MGDDSELSFQGLVGVSQAERVGEGSERHSWQRGQHLTVQKHHTVHRGPRAGSCLWPDQPVLRTKAGEQGRRFQDLVVGEAFILEVKCTGLRARRCQL